MEKYSPDGRPCATGAEKITDCLAVVGFRSSGFVPAPAGGHFIQFLRVNVFHRKVAGLTGPSGVPQVTLEVDEMDFWKMRDKPGRARAPREVRRAPALRGPHVLFLHSRSSGDRLEITSTREQVDFGYQAKPFGHDLRN